MSNFYDEDKLIRDPDIGLLLSEIFPQHNSEGIITNFEQLLTGTNLFGTLIVDYYRENEAEKDF